MAKQDKKQKKEIKNAQKAKITELKKQKKEMARELDTLQGKTTKGKLKAAFGGMLLIALLLSILVGMIKCNVGGVAKDVLAPVIGDIPVARAVLPKKLQRKNASEILAQKKVAQQAKKAKAAQKKAAKKAQAEARATAKAQKIAAKKAAQAAKKQARADAKATAEAQKQARLQDYADTYAKMDPKQAAAIFDTMMSGNFKTVAKILKNIPSNKRALIIANMTTLTAAQITVIMQE